MPLSMSLYIRETSMEAELYSYKSFWKSYKSMEQFDYSSVVIY